MNGKSLRIILATIGLGVVLSGCETLDAYTQESKTSNAAKGAAIGALAGAAVGLASGDDAVERRQRALIGAGVGALAGGAVGYYMDQQEAKLRAELEGTGVSVSRDGDNITLNMPGNVTFASNSSDLSPQFFDVLNSVSKVLTEFDKTVVEVWPGIPTAAVRMLTTRASRNAVRVRLPVTCRHSKLITTG